MYCPKRGDFIWLTFDPKPGHKQMGKRPALVVSHDSFNQKMGVAFVCPISNTQRQNPFDVVVPEGEEVTGVIMTDQMRSLDFKTRKAEFIAQCPELILKDVLRRIKPIIF